LRNVLKVLFLISISKVESTIKKEKHYESSKNPLFSA
jgi:hypothetical protein